VAAPIQRRIAAIFAADVSGYSRLMAASEEATLARLKDYRRIIDGLIAKYRGRFVGSAGDSVLAEFASPVAAVECAVSIQRELGSRNAGLAEHQRMDFRIGINLGDVIVDGRQIYGDGVNIAARLEALAEPGGIAISGNVYEHTAHKIEGISFRARGAQHMKNIPRPVRVYGVDLEGEAGGWLAGLTTQRRHAAMAAFLLVPLVALVWLGAWFYQRSQPEAQSIAVDPASIKTIRDCADCPELVAVPSGTFKMGSAADEEDHQPSEGPTHLVSVTPFAIGRYEVTFGQWDACVAEQACKQSPNDRGWGRGTRPVIYVSWQDTKDFLKWLSSKTGKMYRLPSEAEWEYAARAGSATRFWWGDEVGEDRTNCMDCPGADASRTMPVGSFEGNPFGLYDVHGNVAEWTADCWNGSYAGAPSNGDPWLVGECARRVIRGGAWGLRSVEMRSAYRTGDPRRPAERPARFPSCP
jgi:formylglycine-generating enzyme required for sulfatase activity/class 3 adenylate cyclase